jgi:chitinase
MRRFPAWLLVLLFVPPGCSSNGAAPGDAGTTADGRMGSDDGPVPTDGDAGPTTGVAFVLSPYKDTSINLNWNTNVISTSLSGSAVPLGIDVVQTGGRAVTLAFATGECGTENWAGVSGDVLASTNIPLLAQAGAKYIVSTGGAAGSFTCGTDPGMATFISRWASPNLVGVDFDIEAGQSQKVIGDLVQRIKTAHGASPGLRFSLTLATVANNTGAAAAQSLGPSTQDAFNTYGDETMAAVESTLAFSIGSPASWPSYLTINLMTMDYGAPGAGVCVVSGGACQMGQSALQAAYNLHDRWGVPYANIELTPMIGGNDVSSEQFTLADVDVLAAFAASHGLAGVHYWSYDRDVDCPAGAASATCNSMGVGYAGARGYLKRLLSHLP